MQHPRAWLPICRHQEVVCVRNGPWVLYFCCHFICAECLWSHFVILPPHCCATNQSPCVIPSSNHSDASENTWAESPESSKANITGAENSTILQGASSYSRSQSPAAVGTLTLHLLIKFDQQNVWHCRKISLLWGRFCVSQSTPFKYLDFSNLNLTLVCCMDLPLNPRRICTHIMWHIWIIL